MEMIEALNRQKKSPIKPARFVRLLGGLAKRYGLGRPEITLVFVGDTAMRTLNKAYRRKDKTTDVLSFPLNKKAADGRLYVGDIVISVPQAARQARRLGHTLDRELGILVIHGFLHCLGYDHDKGHEAEEAAAQALFLKG
jgi:probable rRNA maturation factor